LGRFLEHKYVQELSKAGLSRVVELLKHF
jgi:hypothetical protein